MIVCSVRVSLVTKTHKSTKISPKFACMVSACCSFPDLFVAWSKLSFHMFWTNLWIFLSIKNELWSGKVSGVECKRGSNNRYNENYIERSNQPKALIFEDRKKYRIIESFRLVKTFKTVEAYTWCMHDTLSFQPPCPPLHPKKGNLRQRQHQEGWFLSQSAVKVTTWITELQKDLGTFEDVWSNILVKAR